MRKNVNPTTPAVIGMSVRSSKPFTSQPLIRGLFWMYHDQGEIAVIHPASTIGPIALSMYVATANPDAAPSAIARRPVAAPIAKATVPNAITNSSKPMVAATRLPKATSRSSARMRMVAARARTTMS